MLGNNRGRDYDVYGGGERVLSVRYLTPTEPSDCCMCGRSTFDHFAVPYYCGPVRSGKSEGGYAPACQRCYDRWARWDDGLEEYDSWLAVLREGAYGAEASRCTYPACAGNGPEDGICCCTPGVGAPPSNQLSGNSGALPVGVNGMENDYG